MAQKDPSDKGVQSVECSICCGKLFQYERSVSSTYCGHLFHSNCIEQWIKVKDTNNTNCPTCFKKINMNQIHQIFLTYDDDGIQLMSSVVNTIHEKVNETDRFLKKELEDLQLSMGNLMSIVEKEKTKTGQSVEEYLALEQMKQKDAVIKSLQKEVSDLKSKRAEHAREMNTIRQLILKLKQEANGEPEVTKEPKSKEIKIEFTDPSDNLILG